MIDFVRKRRFKPQRERSGVRRKHTITREVELQSVVFVTRQDMFLKFPRKRGKRVQKHEFLQEHFQGKNSKYCVASVVNTIEDHAEIPMVINVCVMESTLMQYWTEEIWRM